MSIKIDCGVVGKRAFLIPKGVDVVEYVNNNFKEDIKEIKENKNKSKYHK